MPAQYLDIYFKWNLDMKQPSTIDNRQFVIFSLHKVTKKTLMDTILGTIKTSLSHLVSLLDIVLVIHLATSFL